MAQGSLTLNEAVNQYKRGSHSIKIEAAEKQREQLLELFPLDSWPEMPLEKYALGTDSSKDSFSYWLEFGTTELMSIRGGTAKKLIIFRHKSGDWYFNKHEYADVHDAWEAVRAGFVEAFRLAEQDEWKRIDEIAAIHGGKALRIKTLFIYFPDQLLPIGSRIHILHFLKALQEPTHKRAHGVVSLNRTLLSALREVPEFKDWSTKELERFLYWWADPREFRRVVKIAPGRDAVLWDDCRDGNYICVGWDDVGDLRDFESKEEFVERFLDKFLTRYNGSKSVAKRKANELWTLTELEPGDLVVANHGLSKVLAVGTVEPKAYEFSSERRDFRHTVHVDWDESLEQRIEPQKKWGMVTIAKVPASLYFEIAKSGKLPPAVADPTHLQIEEALKRKGQLILYGPPGTGKTYQARRFATWWLLKGQGHDDASQVINDPVAFEKAQSSLTTAEIGSRVWWLVANPKQWSWEELFADGKVDYDYGRLQRNYSVLQEGDLVVGYQSTPDKRIVALARVTKGLHTSEIDNEPHISLEPLTRIKNGPTYEELAADPLLKSSEPMKFRNQGTLFSLTDDEASHLFSLLTEREPGLEQFLNDHSGIGVLTQLTFHPSYSYEDFIEGFRPVRSGADRLVLRLEDGVLKRVCLAARANPKVKYLVLIDEINRANVSKVLGEVITLLEKDKRGMTITLPQSKEPFMVPPNVFLLGTMNTSDRSIKLLDVALRRRFAFYELMPDLELLQGAAIGDLPLDAFLEELNRRISRREGREKQIGHAVFLQDGEPLSDSDELARRFRQEILPLLQEYCYDEYDALADLVGEELVDKETQSLQSEVLNDNEKLLSILESEFSKTDEQGLD